MKFKNLSLRIRIFLSMILLVLLASVVIAAVTIYQYKEQSNEYYQSRLDRKEENLKTSINYDLDATSYEVITKNLPNIFKDKIFETSHVHNLEINIYDLEGNLLISSYTGFEKDTTPNYLSQDILDMLVNDAKHRVVTEEKEDRKSLQSSYTYITDLKFKSIGILNLEYIQDTTIQDKELEEFLSRLFYVYIMMFVTGTALAFYISSYITRSIKTVSNKIAHTRLNRRNEKIIIKNASKEIIILLNAYNEMVEELEESAVKLAQGEREQAWREMAKQVAHEIKNPLTPMRLTVQSFQRRFDIKDPEIYDKMNEYSKTLIQQIDTMSSIASAFSNFAKMPTQKKETLNVVEVVKLALDIFAEDFIFYYPESENITLDLDKTQLIRIVTNLVKNATQALTQIVDKKIEVTVNKESESVIILVADNGKGILEEDRTKVFEPKFTTKSSGMGLGLPMVKNIVEAYDGTITFTSEMDKGTVFKVALPILETAKI